MSGASSRTYGGVSAQDGRAERRAHLVEAGLALLGRSFVAGARLSPA